MPISYLSLGSNIGNRRKAIADAVELLGIHAGSIVRQSSLIETKPWGFSSEHNFLNCCIALHTELSPQALLEATQRIERLLGRTSKSAGGVYHDRTIDIDILTYGNVCVNTPDLHIPHPRMRERDFVMRPLREIMPESDIARLR